MTNKPAIGIFGAGWVGLVTGACFAELGYEVVVRDVVPERIETLRTGRVPFHEPGLDELLERNRERLTFTVDVAELAAAKLLFVCVGTPPTYSGDADLSAVWTVVDELPEAEERPILVMKSTVPVGTGEKVRAALDARGLAHVGYVSNPEFLSEGSAVRDFMHPDRVVVGAFTEADAETVASLYEPLEAPVVRADVASAEMIKLAANAFLMTRISFINEIANVCEATGADVEQVAKGIGLDHRLGPHFLRAGIGWGGSCLSGNETVLVRRHGRVHLVELAALFEELSGDIEPATESEVAGLDGLEVLSWREGEKGPRFLAVAAVTRRPFAGELLEVRTKMGRRVRCTPDHPFIVGDGDEVTAVRRADQLTDADWLPVTQGRPIGVRARAGVDLLTAARRGEHALSEIIVRPRHDLIAPREAAAMQPALAAPGHPRGPVARSHDILRSGALRMREADAVGMDLEGAMLGTTTNGTYVPTRVAYGTAFWRVVGLYIAEGHCSTDGRRRRLAWSFHPRDEFDLVKEVVRFWRSLGVKVRVDFAPTATNVKISSRLLAEWWLQTLGLGTNRYEQRLPDLVWSAPERHKRALLTGLWLGDGSWSYICGGPSVILEYGTVSRELADGILRLLGDLGVVARLKVGRSRKSTRDTYWIVVSGADQVEQQLDLLPERDRDAVKTSLARQAKRIAPTGYRRSGQNASWVRVTSVERVPFSGHVYSLEVPTAGTFVTTHGLVVHNCFPKDGVALKQLASNSGYHFQLLNAVIEVNELQKRRVVGKLEKHLGKLRGKTVAVLGLAFKPNTDDLREAPSLVLVERLLAEGAEVRTWDPVADASHLLRGIDFCDSVLEAVTGADAAVIVTEWDELRTLASAEVRAAMRSPVIVDGRNLLDPEQARAAGFTYEGIGRAASPLAALPEAEEPNISSGPRERSDARN